MASILSHTTRLMRPPEWNVEIPQDDQSPLDADHIALQVFLQAAIKLATKHKAGVHLVRFRAALVMLNLNRDHLEELFSRNTLDAEIENVVVRPEPRGRDQLVPVCGICWGEGQHHFGCELSELKRDCAREFQGQCRKCEHKAEDDDTLCASCRSEELATKRADARA